MQNASSADFNKAPNHLSFIDGETKNARVFDLRTHKVIWEGKSVYCPFWLD